MKQLYDRFSFDDYFRQLLSEGYTNEEAMEFIKFNCGFSALVIQERIENGFYKKISVHKKISSDLKELKQEIYNKYFFKNWN